MSVHRGDGVVQVIVAACSGSAGLSESIGLPVVHIDAVADAGGRDPPVEPKGARLRRPRPEPVPADRLRSRGGPTGASSTTRPAPWRRSMGARPQGVRVAAGRLLVSLPPDVTPGRLPRGAPGGAAAPSPPRGDERDGLHGGAQRRLPRIRGPTPLHRPTPGPGSSGAPAGSTISTCSIRPRRRGACSGPSSPRGRW